MDFREVIKRSESPIFEFKSILPSNEKVAQLICVFANGSGGTLVIGVDDKSRDIIGVSESDIFELEEKITNVVIDSIQPIISPIISTFNFEGKYLLLVQIDRGQHKPYYLKRNGLNDGTYIRVGSSTRKATPDIISELERERLNISFDSTPVFSSTPDDLSLDHLEFYLEKRKEVRDIPFVKVTQDWLVKSRLLYKEGGKLYPTVGGILLFSDRVNDFFPNGVIKCARFKGSDSTEFLDQKEYGGPIIYLMEKVLTFFKEHIPRGAKITGAYREESYAFPDVVISSTLDKK